MIIIAGNPPVATYKLGNIKCAVWEKLNTKGEVMQSFTFQKSYKTATGGYGNTTFFNNQDLALLGMLANKISMEAIKAVGVKSDVLAADGTATAPEEEVAPF